eukprot:jgi/Tetstr1/423171/TSEL_013939.t1
MSRAMSSEDGSAGAAPMAALSLRLPRRSVPGGAELGAAARGPTGNARSASRAPTSALFGFPHSSGGAGRSRGWFRSRPASASGGGGGPGGGGFGAGMGFAGGGAFIGSGGTGQATRLWPLGSITASVGKKKGKGAPIKVLIMMSDTGGGHRASAQALKAGFEQLYGKKYTVEIVDFWTKHTSWPTNQVPKTYSFMMKNAWMWRIAFNVTQPRIVHVPMQTVNTVLNSRRLNEAFDEYDPDLVISVHPVMQQTPITILKARSKKGAKAVPFATVVTDLTKCHNTWFHPQVDRCFVPTQEMRAQAKSLGLKDQQLVVHGLPIRPVFSQTMPSRTKLRKMLGLKTNKKTLLLCAGGEGMGSLEQTLKALSRADTDCQVVAICGRNQKLVAKLEAAAWSPHMHVVVKGFVDNMHQFMGASDAIITKAGPGTIAESLICGLPIILNGFVPCQEYGNVAYVTDNGVGAFERAPDKIAAIVRDWFGPAAGELEAMSARAKAMGRPGALFRIVEDLAAMAQQAMVPA